MMDVGKKNLLILFECVIFNKVGWQKQLWLFNKNYRNSGIFLVYKLLGGGMEIFGVLVLK